MLWPRKYRSLRFMPVFPDGHLKLPPLVARQIPPGSVVGMYVFSQIVGASFLVTVTCRARANQRGVAARFIPAQTHLGVGEFEVATGGGIWVAIRVFA